MCVCLNMLFLLLSALLLSGKLRDVMSRPLGEVSKDLLISALRYMDSNPETLEELMDDEYTVLEGDMILSTDRNAINSAWPTHEIPYVISSEIVGRTDDILSAIAMVSKNTCVTFHKRTTEADYLFFKQGKGCASYVGFIGGEQPVFIAAQCIVGNIVHEVLHALGFHHEHTRTDREQYITILPHNIMEGREKNFVKLEGETFDIAYDIHSIMHYGRSFFSANGLPTIVSNTEVKDMGQRVKMTQQDIDRVSHLYNCNGTDEVQTDGQHLSPAPKPEDHPMKALPLADILQQLAVATGGSKNTNREQDGGF